MTLMEVVIDLAHLVMSTGGGQVGADLDRPRFPISVVAIG
jgi:hypothetical protein